MTTPPIRGRCDAGGRLVAADPALLALNLRAGGAIGAPLAVPQIAGLVRLVLRLGIVVSRGVVAADADQDLALWIRAAPEEDGVGLAIVGWTESPARRPQPASAVAREHDFLRAAADWLWECDAALKLTALSAHAARLLGTDGGLWLGQPITRLFALHPDGEGRLPLIEALAARERFDGQRATLHGEDPRTMVLAGVPLTAGDGGFAGFRGTVTEAPAEADPAAGGAFRERLGQALRTPLDRIIAAAEAIRAQEDGPVRGDYAAYAGDIASAGRHLLALVGDLVDLSDIERADFRTVREAIDLADLARAAAGLLAIRAGEAGVTIDRPPEGERLPAIGDYRRTLQILVNLVGNAVRYAPRGSVVRLEGAIDGDRVALSVADDGRGIAADEQARIFEKFARVDPGEADGSGLGLYIARRLARAMGGEVTVTSAPGDGARFTLVLGGN